MKPETIQKRMLEAAIEFARNERSLREEKRAEREHRCTETASDLETGYFVPVCWQDNELEREEWCENCRITMELRKNRGTPRRNRQKAKERMVRLVRLMEASR